MPVAQWGADDQHRQQVGRGCDDFPKGAFDVVEQEVLQDDVLDGVPGQRQLGEYGHRDAVVVACAGQPQNRRGIGRRIADGGVVRACGDADKTLAVAVVEVHRPSIVACRVSRWGRRVECRL